MTEVGDISPLLLMLLLFAGGGQHVQAEEQGKLCEDYGGTCKPEVPQKRVGECTVTTTDCKNIGGTCLNSTVEAECDFVDGTTCPNCNCCIDCAQQATPEKCENKYRGSCKKKCEWPFRKAGKCSKGCLCCGCKELRLCTRAGGRCVLAPKSCETLTVRKWCHGKNCHCCIPDCPKTTSACQQKNGRCDVTCAETEMAYTGLCEKCLCCVDKPCDPTSCCSMVGGQCRDFCQANETRIPGLCLKDCMCCIPGIPCSQTSPCLAVKGNCLSKSEEPSLPETAMCVEGLCMGSRCRCCINNPPMTTEQCFDVNGMCVSISDCPGIHVGDCNSPNEICCVEDPNFPQ